MCQFLYAELTLTYQKKEKARPRVGSLASDRVREAIGSAIRVQKFPVQYPFISVGYQIPSLIIDKAYAVPVEKYFFRYNVISVC